MSVGEEKSDGAATAVDAGGIGAGAGGATAVGGGLVVIMS